jgi:hypothetical protein
MIDGQFRHATFALEQIIAILGQAEIVMPLTELIHNEQRSAIGKAVYPASAPAISRSQ